MENPTIAPPKEQSQFWQEFLETAEEELAGLTAEEIDALQREAYAEQMATYKSYQAEDAEIEEAEEKERRRTARQEMCGTYRVTVDIYTGGPKTFRSKCGLNTCPSCLADRAARLKERVAYVAGYYKAVYMIEADPGSKIVEEITGLGKERYLRLPQRDGRVVLFTDKEVPGGVKLDAEQVDGLDWKELAFTPEGQKLSGTLGSTASKPSEGEAIEVLDYWTDAPVKVQRAAWKEANKQSETLDPKTPEEVEDAVKTRIRLVGEFIRQKEEFFFRFYTRKMTLKTSRIVDWAAYTESLRQNDGNPKLWPAVWDPYDSVARHPDNNPPALE